jgi:hypothetical protein
MQVTILGLVSSEGSIKSVVLRSEPFFQNQAKKQGNLLDIDKFHGF